MKHYPALDVAGADVDLVAAAADAFAPTAIEERGEVTRVFFADAGARDSAASELRASFDVTPLDVPDDDWAVRSQQNLQPVTVGRITILPSNQPPGTSHPLPATSDVVLVIPPSMGFGTGHHATTRLCLAAMQEIGVAGKMVLDVGTGSGVLAIAADRLGAVRAVGIDTDPDAIQSARENLALNPEARRTRFEVADLATAVLPAVDVVVANLTGALLVRAAATLLAAVRPGGVLIVSGLLVAERQAVSDTYRSVSDTHPPAVANTQGIALDTQLVVSGSQSPLPHPHPAVSDTQPPVSDTRVVWERVEDGWVGLAFQR